MAIGADEPTLDRKVIDGAFALLDSCEWVLGPAEDGGYYLIGARAQTFSPEVFLDVPWSTPDVFGVMVESHLVGGRQDPAPGRPLTYGQRITDACLAWPDTVPVIKQLADAVRARRRGAEPAQRHESAG